MPDRNGAHRRAIPFRLDLDQQKKRAKALCRALRAGDAKALARLSAHHPNPPRVTADIRLADAQLVIARELGVSSWPALRRHIERMARSRAAIADKGPVPDADMRTLHLRCGSDLQRVLPQAGFTGDFLEYSHPLCQGPIPAEGDLVAIRARFMARTYGREMDLTEAAFAKRLAREEAALARAAGDYQRIALWFEHDHYDQLILVRVLAAFADHGAPPVLELVSANHFPGSERFLGLGQLPPEGLRLLWNGRRPLGSEALALGARTWTALHDATPSALAAIARSASTVLPDLPGALVRHLQELPWTGDGLGLTERLSLELIAGGTPTIGQVFAALIREREPLPWLGDLMFLAIVEAMMQAHDAPFAVTAETRDLAWPQRRLELTDTGRQLLAGERDWLDCDPPERWVGNVRIARDEAVGWRWDDETRQPTRA